MPPHRAPQEGNCFKGFLYYGNYTDSIGLTRIDKELSISNSTNIGEVSGGTYTAGVVGYLQNYVDSAGTKLYSHNTSFSIIGCSNRGNVNTNGDYGGGVVCWLSNTNSYAKISSKSISNTIVNEVIVKYCFNTGNLSGAYAKAGVISHIYNYVGANGYDGQTNPIRGGKAFTDISCNWNAGDIISGNSPNGIVSHLYNYAYSSSCYLDTIVSNNFNTGITLNDTSTWQTAGIVGCVPVVGVGVEVDKDNVNVAIKSCYNYSVSLSGGNATYRAGVIGEFRNNAYRATLSNNYSAYKRGADSNVHGSAIKGANVGEGYFYVLYILLSYCNIIITKAWHRQS